MTKSKQTNDKRPGPAISQRLDRLFHGRWLSSRFFNRHWGPMLTITVMFILYIGQRYDCLNKMERVQSLQQHLSVIKSEFIRERAAYMAATRQVEMTHRVQQQGLDLTVGKQPPYIVSLNQ